MTPDQLATLATLAIEKDPAAAAVALARCRTHLAAVLAETTTDQATQRIALYEHRCGLAAGSIVGPSRQSAILLCRDAAVYAIRTSTNASYPKLANMFDRDQSTIRTSHTRTLARLQSNDTAAVEAVAVAAEYWPPPPHVAP